MINKRIPWSAPTRQIFRIVDHQQTGSKTMKPMLCRASEQENKEWYWLKIELANDCVLALSCPKNDGETPFVYLLGNGGGWPFKMETAKSFRKWVKVALGKRTPLA